MAVFLELHFKRMISEVYRVCIRFPMTLFFVILTVTRIIMKNTDSGQWDVHHGKVLLTCGLGVILSLGIEVLFERFRKNQLVKGITFLLESLFLFGLYSYVIKLDKEYLYRGITMLYIVFFMLALSVPFFMQREKKYTFESFLISLGIRAVISTFFSGVINLGIALTILSIDALFEVKIRDHVYGNIAAILMIGFNSLYFLAGFPTEYEEKDFKYPVVLKILFQYIVLPLLGIYLAILYVYSIKIIFTGVWPRGLVSYLVSVSLLIGLISFLLVKPLEELNALIVKFNKIFNFLAFPMIAMLFTAIFIRVGDYGITYKRYYLIISGTWLVLIFTYQCLSKVRNNIYIPLTVAGMALLISFGPLSADHVSYCDQSGRLETLLINNHMLSGGVLVKNEKVDQTDKNRISSIINYLIGTQQIQKLPYFNGETDKTKIEKMLGFNIPEDYEISSVFEEQNIKTISIQKRNQHNINFETLKNYEYAISLDTFTFREMNLGNPKVFDVVEGKISLYVDNLNKGYLTIEDKDQRVIYETSLDEVMHEFAKKVIVNHVKMDFLKPSIYLKSEEMLFVDKRQEVIVMYNVDSVSMDYNSESDIKITNYQIKIHIDFLNLDQYSIESFKN